MPEVSQNSQAANTFTDLSIGQPAPPESPPSPEISREENPWDNTFGVQLRALPSQDTVRKERERNERANQRAQSREFFREGTALTINIDKDLLADLELPPNLEPMRETFLRLPEKLEFKPGITLIFGENGVGKSTLASTLLYAINYELTFQGYLDNGETIEKARENAKMITLEKPTTRGTKYEEYIEAGFAPILAQAIKIDVVQTAVSPQLLNIQAEVGRVSEKDRSLGSQPGFRENYMGGFEMDGNAYSDEDITNITAGRKSSRQTVDEFVDQSLDYLFSNPRHSVKRAFSTDTTDGLPAANWDKPDFMKLHELAEAEESRQRWGDQRPSKEKKYYPGIMFIDEPESGISPKRHIRLPDEIGHWAPEGSTLIVPTNSPILYETNLPRIDLDTPEKGIFTP